MSNHRERPSVLALLKRSGFCGGIIAGVIAGLVAGCVTHSASPVKTAESNSSPSPFYLGADISELSQIEESGGVYMDGDKQVDPIALFMTNGWTCFRLRIWVDPRNGINGLPYTVKLARRIKNAGGTFMLDFHYSDWWADPQKQNKPAAWAKLDFDSPSPIKNRKLKSRLATSANFVITLLKAFKNPPSFPWLSSVQLSLPSVCLPICVNPRSSAVASPTNFSLPITIPKILFILSKKFPPFRVFRLFRPFRGKKIRLPFPDQKSQIKNQKSLHHLRLSAFICG